MPAPRSAFSKVIDVAYLEETDTWIAYVYEPEAYKAATEDNPPVAIDCFGALYESTLLSRVREVYEEFEIADTDGEVKRFP